MIVTCEKCDTRFKLPDHVIGPDGAKTRCSKCGHIAVVYAAATASQSPAGSALPKGDPTAAFEDIEDFDMSDLEKMFDSFDDLQRPAEVRAGASSQTTAAFAETTSKAVPEAEDESLLELDVGDLAIDFESKEEHAEASDESPDLEFDLDLDPSKQDTDTLGGELDFDLGDALAFDDETSDTEAADTGAGESFIDDEDDTEIIDLTDLGLDDDFGAPSTEPPSVVSEDNLMVGKTEPSSDSDSDDLGGFDLSDLTLDDEDLDEGLEDTIVPMDEIDFDLDFEFEDDEPLQEVVEEPKLSAPEPEPLPESVSETLQKPIDLSTTDELDLSDLELAIDDEVAKTESKEEVPDLEFSLESDDADAEEDLFDFSMEDGLDESSVMDASEDEENLGELDLSSLELDIDEPASEIQQASSAPEDDGLVGFELDMEEEDEETSDEDEMFELLMDDDDSAGSDDSAVDQLDEAILDSESELDFSDLEDMLDTDSDVKVDVITSDESEELEFELDIERDPAPLSDAQMDDSELELTFDSESGTLTIPDEPAPRIEGAGVDNTETYVLGPEFGAGAAAGGREPDTASLKPEIEAPVVEKAKAKKKKSKKKFKRKRKLPRLLLWLIILIALVGGLIYGYPKLKEMGIEIPVVGEYLELAREQVNELVPGLLGEPTDELGFAKIQILDNTLNGSYVQNKKAGLLFVVRGRIQNNYSHPRSHIQVTAKLFGPGNKLIMAKSAYCGNIIDARDLAEQDLPAMQKRLNNRVGDGKSNVSVAKDRMVPFMVVFDKLPDNMQQFTVEVNRSDKG